MFETNETYITSYLPTEAHEVAAEWTAKKPSYRVLHRIVPETKAARCRNCQDLAYVMISLCRAGPFRYVPSHGKKDTILWSDGGEGMGKGWYIIANTISFECPHCMGKPMEFDLVEAEARKRQERLPWWTD
jgi:hypothetical protein